MGGSSQAVLGLKSPLGKARLFKAIQEHPDEERSFSDTPATGLGRQFSLRRIRLFPLPVPTINARTCQKLFVSC